MCKCVCVYAWLCECVYTYIRIVEIGLALFVGGEVAGNVIDTGVFDEAVYVCVYMCVLMYK